jgi:exodeoxyribonuclease VII small subunit
MTTSDTRGDIPPDIAELSFEKALSAFEDVVARLERGDASLQDSITLYERGGKLKRQCEYLLAQAEMRIEKMTLDNEGRVTGTEPLDAEAAPLP